MAEIVGSVASIIQLVDTALKAKEYIQDFINAPQEQRKLLSEMDDLRPLLTELQDRIMANPRGGILQRMKSPLADFKATMGRFTDKLCPGNGHLSKFSKRLTWTMCSKKDAREYLTKFEQFKTLLNSWLLVDLWDMGQQHQRDGDVLLRSVNNVADTVNSGVTNITNGISQQLQRMNSAERGQIIEWLSPINFFLRHSDISSVRQPGTGGWLLVQPEFREWELGSGRTLWCRGIPGAGKTVLASMVVDYLSQHKNIGVACIYLNHKEADNHTPSKLLSGLWRQLVFDRDIGPLAKKLYHRHHEKRTAPSLAEIVDLVLSTFDEFSKVYIIVDAIDEYPDGQQWILLQRLAAMGPTVNLMITSRPNITPYASLPNLKAVDIHATEEDLRTYVDAEIQSSRRLSRHVQTRPELQDEIHSKISCIADGMFLLAKLHIQSLSTKTTVKAVRDALEELPKDLTLTYDIAMQRIEAQNEEDRKIAHLALTWVANAKRPLTVPEIQTALAIEPGTRELNKDNLMDIEIILIVCAGLVIVDEQLLVRLVHHTTHEYLDSIQDRWFPDAQTEITRTLLTILAFDRLPDSISEFWNPPPLIEYSQYCLVHAAGKPEGPLRNMILEFFGRALQWKQKMGWKWSIPPWDSIWPLQFFALWVAAGANLFDTAKFLLEEAQMNEHPDGLGITIASYYGHFEMVQLLLENGADVNTPTGGYGPPLTAASDAGHVTVVRLLLENGADVNTSGGLEDFALHTALANRHEKIARMLIKHGADVNLQGTRGAALTIAASNGMEDIVCLLLERGADVNTRGGRYGFALHAALANKHERIARLLIENGTDVNFLCEHGGSLTTALWYNMENIVPMLLERGADVNARCGRYCLALHAALANRQEKIARLLIENGAGVNLQGGHYGPALTMASQYDMEHIVYMLLKRGAKVNAWGGRHDFALHTALHKGLDNIAQLLISNGANVNVFGGSLGSPLRIATWTNSANIVKLLLDNGADVNALDEEYGTALMVASRMGEQNIVQILVDNGADVNLYSRKSRSAIQVAAKHGHTSIVQMLVEHGAIIAEDEFGSGSVTCSHLLKQTALRRAGLLEPLKKAAILSHHYVIT
ncbi:ankyrin repeat-containing domain protein [Mycena albidolilacea]|uniref:Ankyrin repeat-containing domain protein n=1 Tax=Mycena albidolilacea TaxID=1033008 RepID=A0AAD6ZSF9_9AGAR|nr:ankyrin repeat-containing domain protein [Mycena albidolilacea]